MRGTVKWFSQERGYGFATSEDGVDYYFSVREIVGAKLPRNGDGVEFESTTSAKGPRATNVRITIDQEGARRDRSTRDDREECQSCGKRMVPRLYYSYGALVSSICPYCGGLHRDFRGEAGQFSKFVDWVLKWAKRVLIVIIGWVLLGIVWDIVST